jgi:uncharacterized integral membrane protein (TIGR00697 family)
MLETTIVFFGVFITLGLITYLGALYTAKKDSPQALIAFYVLFLTLAQFFAAKVSAEFDLGIIELIAPAGVIVFPFTLQLTDMVNEKFGRKTVYEMIWLALFTQIIMVFLLILADIIPFKGETDPLAAFSIVPAITLASWISFIIVERFDAWIYDNLKIWIQEKTGKGEEWWKYLWIRNVFSDLISLGLDSIIFIPLAFLILPSIHQFLDPTASVFIMTYEVIVTEIIGQMITKWLLGIIDTPYMYLTRWIYENN